jgi:NAD(P)-dependent dehydrogenase (short-subunit alcohol dehydrogenase family)
MSKELSEKVAIITGGAAGIGRGCVELFVEEGAKVVIADVDEARGRSLSATLGPATRFMHTDVAKREDVQALVNFAVVEFGGLHIMFNNAGVSDAAHGTLLDDDFSHFERVMRVNVLGVMLGTQLAARHMAAHGGGSIINVASIAGVQSGHGFSCYRASKAGVIHFTKSAAIELGSHLVRVNCICPGNIPTDMGTFAAPAPGMGQSDGDRLQQAVRAVRMKHQPLQRQGRPNDIGQAAVFLGGDRSLQITGQVLSVDGGASAGVVRSQIAEIMGARASALEGRGET